MATNSKSHDAVRLVVTALAVCVVGVGSVFLSDYFHLQKKWFYAAWLTVGMFAFSVQDFGAQAKNPRFAAFLVLQALTYGATVAFLLRWIGLLNAVFLSLIVLVFGYILAETIFDVRPTRKMKKPYEQQNQGRG
jgi:hypothetical protein